MRKSIFEIVRENIDLISDAKRINDMAMEENNVLRYSRAITIYDCVDRFGFSSWKHRDHCVDLDDYHETIHYDYLLDDAIRGSVPAFITLIEYIYNLWQISKSLIDDESSNLSAVNNFNHLKRVMDDDLEKLNHKVVSVNDKIIIVEDKPEVSAVAEIVEPDLSFDVIRYNHHALKGNIELKRSILLKMGNALEPRQDALIRINPGLKKDIFCLLNNMNIRHNNCDKQDRSNYKECVAQMPDSELEEWYDELYQMMLLAFLLLDNIERTQKVSELKAQFGG